MKNTFFIGAILLSMSLQASAQSNESTTGFNGSVSASIPEVLFKGQWLKVDFLVEDADPGSELYMMISDEKGKFHANSDRFVLFYMPVSGPDVKGHFNVTIPERIAEGSNYRMRIVCRAGDGKVTIWESAVELKDMYTWYVDQDGDGLGDPQKSFVSTKSEMKGYVLNGLDKDDEQVEMSTR
ncbi:MAG: hypothetical protein R2794_01260 [Chitinophagales bacterium]